MTGSRLRALIRLIAAVHYLTVVYVKSNNLSDLDDC